MLFSIIITTYGRGSKIKRAVLSCLNQKYQDNYEIIVVDDNGRDTENQILTENILKKYSNIKYIKLDKNMGANFARNIGITKAKGKYICLLDDDDEFMEEKLLELEKEIIISNPDLIYSNVIYVDEHTKKERTKFKFELNREKIKVEILKGNFIGSNSFVCLKKAKLMEVGMFNLDLKSCQDWDMWIRIIFNGGKVQYCSKKLVKYYIDKTEKTRITNNYKKRLEGHLFIQKETLKYLNSFSLKEKNEIIVSQNKLIGNIFYEERIFKKYREYFKKGYSFYECSWKDYLKYLFSYFNIKLDKSLLKRVMK